MEGRQSTVAEHIKTQGYLLIEQKLIKYSCTKVAYDKLIGTCQKPTL